MATLGSEYILDYTEALYYAGSNFTIDRSHLD